MRCNDSRAFSQHKNPIAHSKVEKGVETLASTFFLDPETETPSTQIKRCPQPLELLGLGKVGHLGVVGWVLDKLQKAAEGPLPKPFEGLV